MKRLIVVAACLLMAACTTTHVELASDIAKPKPNATVLALKPDVQLSELTASGLKQTRSDWSSSARDNLSAALKEALDAKGLKYVSLDPSTVTTGRNAQLLRLNQAVDASILLYGGGAPQASSVVLPTHKGAFDWTVGDGAQSLAQTYGSDYMLYVMARGDYSSSGRKAVWLVAAAAGVSLPLGGQAVVASLVDLKTGQVVWNNVARAAPDADMRTPDGARLLMSQVLKSAPF